MDSRWESFENVKNYVFWCGSFIATCIDIFCLYGGSMDYLLTLLIFFPFIGAILAIGIKENLKAYAVVISFIELGWHCFYGIALIEKQTISVCYFASFSG